MKFFKNQKVIQDQKERWKAILNVRESRRTQEEIIEELSLLIEGFRKDEFLPFLIDMIVNVDQRESSELYRNLLSPIQQLVYLIDLFFSVENGGTKVEFSREEWNKITLLLNEIEKTYFVDIGFFNENTNDGIDFEKVHVSLFTFLDYFGNSQLTYEEQTLARFESICGVFDCDIFDRFGFTVKDAVNFCSHIRGLLNKKLNDCHYYLINQNEWIELTAKFSERGLVDPKDWWNEPELSLMREFKSKPGFIFIQSLNDIAKVDITTQRLNKILDFLLYNENIKKNLVVYYADKNPFIDTPLIKLNSEEVLCPQYKFLIECFYNRINAELAKIKKEKYTKFKNQMLEKKAAMLFRKLLGKEALIFESYYFNEIRSEQDLLIFFKGFYFIVEIKDTHFRAPMRNPIKSFEKIKSDFKKSIQYGYDQCKRVENKIEEGKNFKIYDSKTNKSLFEIKPNQIKDYFSIVITQFRYGTIQTNLDNLLVKEQDALYPLSICIDDLEAFILALRKIKKEKSKMSFIDYLKHREYFHERLFCNDELELCGFFINSPNDFKEVSYAEETFSTFHGMSALFDAEYMTGLGFENELDFDIKKQNRIPSYPKSYNISKMSGIDILDDC